MKIEVTFMVGGKVLKEIVYAIDYQEARSVLLARQPNAIIVSVTAKF